LTQKAEAIDKALTAKGFVSENARHHVMYWFYYEGKKSQIRTRISFGEKEVGAGLISAMARETKLRKCDFLALVECSLSADEYRTKMLTEGHVRP
jgi:hypothetical protein